MAELTCVERKSPVLKRPSLACLARYHTINLTAGCPYECRYCYAQGFRCNPGRGKVLFYANTAEALRRELPRRRRRPELVYFSTACEPFMPDDRVLNCLYEVMSMLLDHSVRLLISTKSLVPQKFIDLFAPHRELVHVQVGLTTMDDEVRLLLEPNAASVEARLKGLSSLRSRGISAEPRMDPLTPELTDTDASFAALCRAVVKARADTATVSYLFLRQSNVGRMSVEMAGWSFRDMAQRVYTEEIRNYCGGGTVRIPAAQYRREKYARLKAIASEQGLSLRLCHCKNPDVTTECCHPKSIASVEARKQSNLFME